MLVNGNSLGGTTSLMQATRENKFDVAERLLEMGADPNIAEAQHRFTALHLSPSAEMTALLLRYNANPHAIDGLYGGTPLHSACFNNRSDIIPLLIAKGCDVNARDRLNGSAPLHIAATEGHVPSLTALMAANADSSLLDKSGSTPLHLAVANDKIEAVSFLASLPGAPLNNQTNHDWTALQWACNNGRSDMVRVLLENNAAFDNVGYYLGKLDENNATFDDTIFYPTSIMFRHGEATLVLSTLLEFGCPLWRLVRFNILFGWAAERIVVLLGAGCDVDEYLHLAIPIGRMDFISLLVAEGANLNAVNVVGCTPLHVAVRSPVYYEAAITRLISLGANVNAINKEGQTPLHIAAQNMDTDTVETLVQQGCNVHIRDNIGQSALDVFEKVVRPLAFYDLISEARPAPPPSDVVHRIRLVLATKREGTIASIRGQCAVS